ncbi:MAG: transglycosylase domain-containing protein [Bacteroidaceae bacterium]|nr:transglycosylase domain-containing protein [Bacteroidaceae bacterium]
MTNKGKKIVRIINCCVWIIAVAVLLSLTIVFKMMANGKIGYMPTIEELENPIDKYASQVISSDGVVLGTYSREKNNRVKVAYEDLSPNLVKALIATEDVRYLDHSGIDFRALLRAIIKRGVLGQTNAGGGSTITQQLAKLLYTVDVAHNTFERMLQKPMEWVIAVELERCYTKEEIITMYLNKYDFCNNSVGIFTASNYYFSVNPIDLSVTQAATLVGLCQNSSYYNPKSHPDRALERRNVVLNQMLVAGYITEQECEEYSSYPLDLNISKVDHQEGLATYFREYLRGVLTAKEPVKGKVSRQKYYEDSIDWADNPLFGWCNKNRKEDGTPYDLYTDGLKIYTTIDSRMQIYAENAVSEHLRGYLQPNFFIEKSNSNLLNSPYAENLTEIELDAILKQAMRNTDRYRHMHADSISDERIFVVFEDTIPMKLFTYDGFVDTLMSPLDSVKHMKSFLRCGFMCMETKTGQVKAYVGGPEPKQFKYDMVNQGRRQVGSTIKPFLYSMAMESGYTPCDEVINQTQSILTSDGKIWSPKDEGTTKIGEYVSIKWGLSRSNNNVTAFLMSKLSPRGFRDLLFEYGLRNRSIAPVPAICLGTCDVSVSEMVGAYSAFPNKGIRMTPLYATRIESNNGELLESFSSTSYEVISEETSYKMIDMMKAVISEGTGVRLKRYMHSSNIAGKTGTTNNQSDAWFMGYTPDLVVGCWIGGEDRSIHFNSMQFGQGSRMALPVCGIFLDSVYSDSLELGYLPSTKFDIPLDFDPCSSDMDDFRDNSHEQYFIESF